jgi:hypothetical protein
VAHWTAKAE